MKYLTPPSDYKYGFKTEIESETLPPGLSEEVIRQISALRQEPQFMLEFRLKAFAKLQQLTPPTWPHLQLPEIDLQQIVYYSSPKGGGKVERPEELNAELLETFERLGIPLDERRRIMNEAVDAVFDSVSIYTSHKKKLMEYGIIFCSISEAARDYPELVEPYLGSVVPIGDNYWSALNSAVFTDGSFVYVPPGITSPMDLSTYFRLNNVSAGQFERTLIIAAEDSYVSYLEGCTAPAYDEKQLHAAVVELIALDRAKIKYSTVQNWYTGNKESGEGGVYNFVTKRALCKGEDSSVSWTQVETGAAINWKYPSCVLLGDRSSGEFYSVALTNGKMQTDTGSKMIHIGKETKSTVISKGISADQSSNAYRGAVEVRKNATGARNYTACDSMLVGKECGAHTFPYIVSRNPTARLEHEASTSRISEEQLFFMASRGIDQEKAIGAVIGGFCKDVFKELPGEFAAEARELLVLKLEKSVG